MNFKQAYKDITVVEYNILSKGNEKKRNKDGGGVINFTKLKKKPNKTPKYEKITLCLTVCLYTNEQQITVYNKYPHSL